MDKLRKRVEEIIHDAIKAEVPLFGPWDYLANRFEQELLSLQEETRREEREATIKRCAENISSIGRAHTYASENADLYQAYDNGVEDAITEILSLLDKAPFGGKEKA